MVYSWQALSAVWIIILAVFVLIASGTVSGASQWVALVGGIAAPAIILSLDERRAKAGERPVNTVKR